MRFESTYVQHSARCHDSGDRIYLMGYPELYGLPEFWMSTGWGLSDLALAAR